MKNNNSILKLLTIAFLAIGMISQVCMAADDESPLPRVGSRGRSVGSGMSFCSTKSFMGVEPGHYFERKHTEALRDELAREICVALFGNGHTPWVGASPVSGILEHLSGKLAGGEAEPLFENLAKQRLCEDAVVLDMVDRLNKIANPNSPAAIWTVCRAVQCFLSNRKFNCRWLNRISAVGDDVVDHLIGDSGVVTPVLIAFADAREVTPDLARFNEEDRGAITNVFELSDKFCRAANGFPGELLTSRMIDAQRRPFLGTVFSGLRITASMAELFDSAFLHADFFAHVTPVGMSLVTSISRTAANEALANEKFKVANRKLTDVRGDLARVMSRLETLTREHDAARIESARWWLSAAKWMLCGGVLSGTVTYFGLKYLTKP